MRIFLLSVFVAIMSFCITFSVPLYADETSESTQADSAPDWFFYSMGLNYKLSALSGGATRENIENMNKALECFLRAERSGAALDRVYFQISDCYYYLRDLQKSIEYSRKSISVNPQNIEPYNRLYAIYMGTDNHEQAAAVLEDYCAVNPHSVEMRFALGEHYYSRMNDFVKAAESFKQVVSMSGESLSGIYYKEYAYYYLGYLAFQNNKPDEALEYYEAAYAINNSNMKSIYMLALLYMELYSLDKAEQFAEMYLEAHPDTYAMHGVIGHVLYLKDSPYALSHLKAGSKDKSVQALVSRGLYLAMLGKSDEAGELLRSIERYNSNVLSVHLALAGIYGEEGDESRQLNELMLAGVTAYKAKLFNIALPSFNTVSRLKDDIPEPFYYLGRIYEDMGNYALAVINYKKAHDLRPGADLMLHIGYVHGLNKNYTAAFKYFDDVTAEQPKNSIPYFYRGLFAIQKTDYNKAEKNLQKAIELDDGQESYYLYLAVALEKNDKVKEAVKLLEKALQQSPDSGRVNNFLGYLYADYNMNIDRSFVLIRKALEEEPDNGAYLDSLGWAYFRKGMYSEALAKLLEAERQLDLTESSDSVVYDHIGDVYNKLGDAEQAAKYWEKSLQLEENKTVRAKLSGYRK